MALQVTRRIEWDMGHRLMAHAGKCANYHGHRYVAEVTVELRPHEQLDAVGTVVDFSCLKEKVGGWVDEHWDHGMALQDLDPLAAPLRAQGSKLVLWGCPPTAENIAEVLFGVACNVLDLARLRVVKVRVWETPNCWAEYGGAV